MKCESIAEVVPLSARTSYFVVAVIVAIVVSDANAFDDERERPSVDQPKPKQAGPPHTPGVAYVDIGIARRISRGELTRYAETLHLDESQRKILDEHYESYLKANAEFRAENVQSLWDQSAAIAATGPSNLAQDPSVAAAYAELMRRQERVTRDLCGIEDQLFIDLEPFLTDEQLPLVDRVRQQRARMRYSVVHCEYPGAGIDLSLLVYNLRENLTPRDPEAFEAGLTEYERAVTALMRRDYDANLEAMAEVPALLASRPINQLEDPDEAAQTIAAETIEHERIMREVRQISRRHAVAGKRVHDLNREYVATLAGLLTEPSAKEFTRRFREAAYPPVYPDPYDIEHLVVAVLGIAKSMLGKGEVLQPMADLYVELRDNLSEQMVRKYLSWQAKFVERRTFALDELDRHQRGMRRLQEARAANAAVWIDQVRGVLTPDQLGEIADRLIAYEDLARRAEQAPQRPLNPFEEP